MKLFFIFSALIYGAGKNLSKTKRASEKAMPTYEYKCESCGYIFEEFQSITDEAIKICPKCGGSVKRLISGGIGLIFKGSGFYITDYKHGNSSKNGSTSDIKSKTESEKNES